MESANFAANKIQTYMKPTFKKIRNATLIAGLALLAVSCGTKEVRNPYAEDYEDRCTIKKVGEKNFRLDESSDGMFDYVQYIDNDTLPMFSFLNIHLNAIYLYDMRTCELLDTIVFQKEGNDGVGALQGYHYINADSIITYQAGSGRIALADSEGHVKQRYVLMDMGQQQAPDQVLPNPDVTTDNPILYANHLVSMGGGYYSESSIEITGRVYTTLHYNLATGEISYANRYPEIYRKWDWGMHGYYRSLNTALDKDNNILISFAADHNLWRYNPETGISDSLYAGSREVKSIKPFSTAPKEYMYQGAPAAAVQDWYETQPSYDAILYDPWRQLYYRFVRFPRADALKNFFNNKPVGIIVLDKDLKYLGEERFPENNVGYDTFDAFVTPEGLFMKPLVSEDEDKVTFYQYQVIIEE